MSNTLSPSWGVYWRLTTILPLILALLGCASSVGGGFNDTTRINDLKADLLATANLTNVVVAHVNLGAPSRNYVARAEPKIDAQVANYLRSHGYKVHPQREFSQRWENAKLIYGDPIDPTTGRVNRKTFALMVTAVRDQMREQTSINTIVFTDLIEREVYIASGMNRVARFDGVSRKPSLRGAGSGVTSEFDWGAPVAAISIQIGVYNLDLEQVFLGIGGIDLSDAIDTRSGRGFVRRKDILDNEAFIEEGLQLAMHPLIVMNNWPGQRPEGE